MQDQESLKLHWHSLSGWGGERVTVALDAKGGEYLIDGCLQPIAT